MQHRLDRLREKMQKQKVSALLVTSVVNRHYISGFTGTAGILLITGNQAYLITDGRYTLQASEQSPHFEILQHEGEPFESVSSLCQKESISLLSFEEEHVSYAEYRDLVAFCVPTQLKPTIELVEQLRLIKDEQELMTLKRATDIVDRIYVQLLDEIRPGLTEQQVATRIEFLLREMGGTSSSFSTIVASGKRSALPHGIASNKVINRDEMITLDFGCWVDGYTSDITRTFFLGKPDDKHREIYGIVLESQQSTLSKMRPGMTGKEVDRIARDVIEGYGYGDFYRHGTGHGIGLEIHEAPTLRMTSEEILQPGMVVTVEPGIYLPDAWGVRIEDDVVITETGATRLTKASKDFMAIA